MVWLLLGIISTLTIVVRHLCTNNAGSGSDPDSEDVQMMTVGTFLCNVVTLLFIEFITTTPDTTTTVEVTSTLPAISRKSCLFV